uniref:Secoisolariciresinol dehydrogenase-like n=1 Tax=Nicotiana tabacum TaxID=4097 RepID=A0A1S3XJ84_TOBAC|nr:PREDICTED: secoisolariciresinol dehydrogenase-like [Nicotiana tabacum]
MTSSPLLSTMAKRLEGIKVALISGGASGIGEGISKLFCEHGAKVAIADVQDEIGQLLSSTLCNSTYIHCDVTNEEDVQNAVNKTVSDFGKLDVMICSAGIGGENKPRIIDNDKADFERVVSINLTGVFLCMKHAARVMVPAKQGYIISMESVSSVVGAVVPDAYTSAKHAVLGLTKNLSVEFGQFGIRVNCLSPYALVTPLATKFIGILDPEKFENTTHMAGNLKGVTLREDDVAKAALFLASDDAKYLSGHNLLIDGGFGVFNPSLGMFKYPEST